MADSQKKTLVEHIHSWVPTLGIIIAAAWGVYTFVYQEIIIPKSAPVNITINLQLQKVGANNLKSRTDGNLEAVEIKVLATNPSSRIVYLLPSYWVAYGMAVNPIDENSFTARSNAALESAFNYSERYSEVSSTSVIAIGRLFSDDVLKPGETTMRTVIFHIPAHKYDLLEVSSYIPATSAHGKYELKWHLNDNSMIDATLYRVEANGKLKIMEKNKNGGYSDEKGELQAAHATSQLSLWH